MYLLPMGDAYMAITEDPNNEGSFLVAPLRAKDVVLAGKQIAVASSGSSIVGDIHQVPALCSDSTGQIIVAYYKDTSSDGVDLMRTLNNGNDWESYRT